MGTNPEQLKHEIENTRRDVSTDVDALTEKVHPKRVVGRRVGRARNAMGNLRDRVMGGASDATSGTAQGISSAASGVGSTAASAASEGNPLAAGMIAFGVGWLVSSLLPASRQEQRAAARVTGVARDTAQPLAQQAGQALSELKDDMRQPAQRAAERVRSAAAEAAGTVQDQARSSGSKVAGSDS